MSSDDDDDAYDNYGIGDRILVILFSHVVYCKESTGNSRASSSY